jgi:DNA-directed RNA polymerase specialized sigma24 family protein
MNRLRDEARKSKRRPDQVQLSVDEAGKLPSPLEELVGKQTLERYEKALEKLRPSYREAVIGYVELGYTTEELQTILDKPTIDATRMTISRALAKLAEEMGHDA